MTLRKLCLLLFATAPEKGSFKTFLTVRKIFFLPSVPNTDNGQKSAESVCYCVCYYFSCFSFVVVLDPKYEEKPQYLVVFRCDL